MVVALIKNGVVEQVWRDVKTPAELKKKYGLWGANYRAVPNAVAGQIEQGGELVNPTPSTPAPQPDPDIVVALRLLAIDHPQQSAIEALLNRTK